MGIDSDLIKKTKIEEIFKIKFEKISQNNRKISYEKFPKLINEIA